MADRIFIMAHAQSDARVWPLALAIARAFVKCGDETDGDGVGSMDIHVSEGLGDRRKTDRYVSLTFTMPAAPIDAALAKVGILPAEPEDATAARFAAMELE